MDALLSLRKEINTLRAQMNRKLTEVAAEAALKQRELLQAVVCRSLLAVTRIDD